MGPVDGYAPTSPHYECGVLLLNHTGKYWSALRVSSPVMIALQAIVFPFHQGRVAGP